MRGGCWIVDGKGAKREAVRGDDGVLRYVERERIVYQEEVLEDDGGPMLDGKGEIEYVERVKFGPPTLGAAVPPPVAKED